MDRLLLLFLLQIFFLTGCGQVFIGFVSNPQVQPSSVSGIVVVVRVESTNGLNGVPTTFTAVTFANGGLSNIVNFCGDQQNQFTVNQSVRADFTPGTACSTLVAVVIL